MHIVSLLKDIAAKIRQIFENKVIGQMKNKALAIWELFSLPLYTITTKTNNSELVPHTGRWFSSITE